MSGGGGYRGRGFVPQGHRRQGIDGSRGSNSRSGSSNSRSSNTGYSRSSRGSRNDSPGSRSGAPSISPRSNNSNSRSFASGGQCDDPNSRSDGQNYRSGGPNFSGNAGASGLSPRPNFNQPRRPPRQQSRQSDNWSPRGAPQRGFVPWQGGRSPHFNTPPPYFRGRGQNQFLPYRFPPPPIPTNYAPPPILEFTPIVQPQKPQTPHLGSEEERLQKITEAADKLKRKLSSVPKEPHPWYNDSEDTAIALSAFDAVDDTRITSRGIPELKHDPPELNLTLSDLRDIGRVDQDHTGKTAKVSAAPSDEIDDQEVMILEHNPVQERIPADTIDIDFGPDDDCVDYPGPDGKTSEFTENSTEILKPQENIDHEDESSIINTNQSIADESRSHDENATIDSNETIDNEKPDETGSYTLVNEPITEDSTEAQIVRTNEIGNEFCGENVEGEIVETGDDGTERIDEEIMIDRQGDEKCKETQISGDETRIEDNATCGEINDEGLADRAESLRIDGGNELANKENEIFESSATNEERPDNPEKLVFDERSVIGQEENVINDSQIEEMRKISSETRDRTENNDGEIVKDESSDKNTIDTKNDETKGEIFHESQDKGSSETQAESVRAINPEKTNETRDELTSDIHRASMDETGEEEVTQESQVESSVKDDTVRETSRETRDMTHSELSCDNKISESQQNKNAKSQNVAINEPRVDEYPARQSPNIIIVTSAMNRKREEFSENCENPKRVEKPENGNDRSERRQNTRDRVSKTDDPDKTERTSGENNKKQSNDDLTRHDEIKSADRRESRGDSPKDRNIRDRRKIVRKNSHKSSSLRAEKSSLVDFATRTLQGDFYANESSSPTISGSSIAFNPRELPPLMNSFETTNYGISTQSVQDNDESLQIPPAFDPRFTNHNRCVTLSTPMSVGQDFAMSQGFPSCAMTNLVPNVAPLNYGIPGTIMRSTNEPTSNVQSLCINDPYTPLISMPGLPVVAPIVLSNDMILPPPLPADPPPLPPIPGKSGLDMIDELEDMQEAMEFAKQFMNMSETAGDNDGKMNDPGDSDSSDIFHMPTFPDLPPIELPPLPPEEPEKIIPNPPPVSSRELKKANKKQEEQIVTYGPEPMPEKQREKVNNEIVVLDEPSVINDEQLRPKVVFNLSSKTRRISKQEEWQQQQDETIETIAPATLIPNELTKNRKNKLSQIPAVVMATTKEKLNLNGHEERKKDEEKTLKYNGKLEQTSPARTLEKKLEVAKSPSSCPSVKLSKRVKEVNDKLTLVNHEKVEVVTRRNEVSSKKINDPQTPESSWKSRVIGRFLKMSKNDICNMLNNTGLRKFDIAMKHLVKERRSLGMRSNEEERSKEPEISYNREEFMDQLSAMLDPSATVDVCNLPTQFIHHLSEVLQLDTMEFEAALGTTEPPVRLTLPEVQTPPKIVESRRKTREPQVSKNTKEIDDHKQRKREKEKNSISTLSGNAVSTVTPASTPTFVVSAASPVPPAATTATSIATPTVTTRKPKIPKTRELVESRKCESPSVENIVVEPIENRTTIGPRSRRRRFGLKTTQQLDTIMGNGTPGKHTDVNLVNMADVDDIFSAGIARAKKKNVDLVSSAKIEKERTFITDERRVMIVKEPTIDRVERAAVELDEIFTAGIARAKLASKKAAAAAAKAVEANDGDDDDEENPGQSWNQIDRRVEHRRTRQKTLSRFSGKIDNNKWSRRKAHEDPDAFRNLTKEEWEAKQGETSYVSYQREYRAMMEMRARRGNSNISDVKNDSTTIVSTENVSAKSRLGEPVQASGSCYDNWAENDESLRFRNNEEIIENRDQSDDSSSSTTSSTSSDESSEKEPEVTKLLKVIKEREKMAKKKSLNEEIRDEVAAEIERKRRERDRVKKRHKTRPKKGSHHRRKREKKDKSRDRKRRDRKRRKHKSRRSGENSRETSDNDDADEEYTSSASKGRNSRNLLTEEQIKKEKIIVIKDEPQMEIATTSTKKETKSLTKLCNDDSRPPSTASSSSIPSVVVSATNFTSTLQQPKTKAQLKQMPEIIVKNSALGDISEDVMKNRETPVIEDSRENKKNKADSVTSSDASNIMNEFDDSSTTIVVSSAILQQGSIMSDDVASASRSNSKKLDIKAYKERTRHRHRQEQEKLRFITDNPSSLTRDLLNIPLLRKKDKEPEKREEIDQKIGENSTMMRNEELSSETKIFDNDIDGNATSDTTTSKSTENVTALSTTQVSMSQSDSSQETSTIKVVRKKIIRRPLITTSLEKSTTIDSSSEISKFAHIKSEGGKELKLREKLRRGNLRNSTESSVAESVVNKPTRLKRRRSLTDSASTKESANLTANIKHVPLSENIETSTDLNVKHSNVSKISDVSKVVDVSKNFEATKCLNITKNSTTAKSLNTTKILDNSTSLDISTNLSTSKTLDTITNLDDPKNLDITTNLDDSKNLVVSTNSDISTNLDISQNFDITMSLEISENCSASTDVDNSKKLDTTTSADISKNMDTLSNSKMAESLTIPTNSNVLKNCDTPMSLNNPKIVDTSTILEESENLGTSTNLDISKNLDTSITLDVANNFDIPSISEVTNILDIPTTLSMTNILDTPTTLSVTKILDTPKKRLISDALPDTVPQDSFSMPLKTVKIVKSLATETELGSLDLPIEELPDWSLEAAEITSNTPDTIDYSSESLPFKGFTEQPILRRDRVLTEAEINTTELQALENVPLDFLADSAISTNENVDLDDLTSTGVVDSLDFTDQFTENRDEIESSLLDPLGQTIFSVADEIVDEPVSINLVAEESLLNDHKIDDEIDNKNHHDEVCDKIDDIIDEKVDDIIDEKIDDNIDEKIDAKVDDKINDNIDDKIDDDTINTKKSIIIISQATPALDDSATVNFLNENSPSQEILPFPLLVTESTTCSDTKELSLPELSSKDTNDENEEKQNTIVPFKTTSESTFTEKTVNKEATEIVSLKGEIVSIETEALRSTMSVKNEKTTYVEPLTPQLVTLNEANLTGQSSKTCEFTDKKSITMETSVPNIESQISDSKIENSDINKISSNPSVVETINEKEKISSTINESSRNIEVKSKDSHQSRTKDGHSHGKSKKKSSRHHNHGSKASRKIPLTEKMVEDAIAANVVKLVAKPSSKETVMARMIEIDVEIHKLMNEKMTLYKMLESGDFGSQENNEARTSNEKIPEVTKNVEKNEEETRQRDIVPPKVLASRLVRNLATPTKQLDEIAKRNETKKVNNEIESKTKKRKDSPQRESIKNRGREYEINEVHRERKNVEKKIETRRTASEETSSLRDSREKSVSSIDLEDIERKRRKKASKSTESLSNRSKSRNAHSSKEDIREASREKSISSIDREIIEEKRQAKAKKFAELQTPYRSKSRNEHSSKEDIREGSREKSVSSMDLEDVERKRRSRVNKLNELPSTYRSKSRNEHSSKEDIREGSRDNTERKIRLTKSETEKRERTKRKAKTINESKKNEEPMKKSSKLENDKPSGLGKSAGRTSTSSGVIYSDESTVDSVEPESIQNKEIRGKKETTGYSKGLVLLEESFKRDMAEQRKAKAVGKRKNKQRELRRVLLDPTTLTPDEAQTGLANLLNRKNIKKKEILAMKDKSMTSGSEISGKIWKHVTTVIDAVAENRVEQLYTEEAEKSYNDAAEEMENVDENVENEREEADDVEEEKEEEEDEEESVERLSEKPKDELDQISKDLEKDKSTKKNIDNSIAGTEEAANIEKSVEPEVTIESSKLKESENRTSMPFASETTTSLVDSGTIPQVDVSSVKHTIQPEEVNIPGNDVQNISNEDNVNTAEERSANSEKANETFTISGELKANREIEEAKETGVHPSSRSVSPEYPVAEPTTLKNQKNEEKDEQPAKSSKISRESSRDDRISKIDEETSEKNEIVSRRKGDKKVSRSRSRSSHSSKKRHKSQNEYSTTREKISHDRERQDSTKRDQSEDRHDEISSSQKTSSSRPRSGSQRKQREKAGPPARRASRYSEDVGKTSSSRKRTRARSNSRGSSPDEGESSRKRNHQTRRSTSPLVASIDEQARRRGKKRKRRVELTRHEMASCKVELIDCKYTYMSPNMHPKILKKLGISKINPYVPPILVAENLASPELTRNEKTPSPPTLSEGEIAEISNEVHEDTERENVKIDEIEKLRFGALSEIPRERSSSPEDILDIQDDQDVQDVQGAQDIQDVRNIQDIQDLKENYDEDDDDEEEDDETEDTIHIVKVVDENLPNVIMSDQEEEPDSIDLNAPDPLLDPAGNDETPTGVIAVEEDETIEDDDMEEYQVVDDVGNPTDDNNIRSADVNDEIQVLEEKEPAESTEKIVQQEEILESDNDDDCVVETRRTRYTVHKGPILDIKVLDDSFLAASEDGAIYRYSQTSNGILNIYKGHEAAVTCIHVLEMPGKRWNLYSGSLDGTFRCYDITTGAQDRPLADVGSPIQCMDQAWGTIYVGTKSGHISRYNIKSGSVKGDRLEFSDKSVLALKACTEGPRRVLIVASRNQPITIRDALTGLFLRTVCGYKNHTVYSLLREGNLVYCGTSNTSIPVYNFTNAEQVTQYHAGVGIVCMRLYRQILFAGCYDGNIYVFDTKEAKLVCSIPGPGNMLLSMEVVDDQIIAGSKNRQLHSWRMPRQVRALLAKRT